jgi:hypothetical protein
MGCGFEAARPRHYTGSMESKAGDDMALCHVLDVRDSLSIRRDKFDCWGLVGKCQTGGFFIDAVQ